MAVFFGGGSLQDEKIDSTFDVKFSICLGFYELYLKEIWQIIMNWKIEILPFISKVWLSFVGIPNRTKLELGTWFWLFEELFI